jgi:hypothetical protein
LANEVAIMMVTVDPGTLRDSPDAGPPGDRVLRIWPSRKIPGFVSPKSIWNPPNWLAIKYPSRQIYFKDYRSFLKKLGNSNNNNKS